MREVFESSVAFITGGASGIGRALGVELARRGAEVVLADRQHESASEVAAEICGSGGKAHALELDVRDHEAFRHAAQSIVERSGRIDYFFNNAGITVGGLIENYRIEDWDEVFDVNLRGVAYGIQAVYPIMIAQGSGHIINTASVAGIFPGALAGSYCASKHGVVGLSRTLRIEAKRHGVRVSVLCPGAVDTPILRGGKYGRSTGTEGWDKHRSMEPDVFARKALDAVGKNQLNILLPKWYNAVWWLDRVAPRLTLRLCEAQLNRDLTNVRPAELR
jgi:NAD(P)-dependent dehydrogenase (short-subunit alcohol dehydrogenase family)